MPVSSFRPYLASLFLAAFLVIVVMFWAMFLQGNIFSLDRIVDFSSAVSQRLFNVVILFPSVKLIVGGMVVLVLLSTCSAWLQVFPPSRILNRFDLLLFAPSFVPVYVYAISFDSTSVESSVGEFSALVFLVSLGNGLWWWWHRQFVENLRALKHDKAASGMTNMGLSAEQYFVLPEYARSVWKKLPEIALWVLVNSLFVEAAMSERNGILFELVRSLSDGGRSVDWIGVVTTVVFIVIVWLCAQWVSELLLSRPTKYRGWGLIRQGCWDISNDRFSFYRLVVSVIVASLPLIIPVVIFCLAVEGSTPYWELLGVMMSVSILVYVWVLGRSLYQPVRGSGLNRERRGDASLAEGLVLLIAAISIVMGIGALLRPTWESHSLAVYSNVYEDKVLVNGVYRGESPLNLRLPTGQYIVRVEREGYESIEQRINLRSPQALPIELTPNNDDLFSEDATRPIPTLKIKDTTFLGSSAELGQIFLVFLSFLLISTVVFFAVILTIALYYFSAHYKWKGANWRWWFYRLVSQILNGLSRVPPYLLLVITIFWLGFQTFHGCMKQFNWTLALLLVLLPTQLLRVSSWIDEASNARFLTARRSLGISAFGTFGYLLRTRWMKDIVALVAFSVGLGVLMDISMVWLLGERGSFTCDGRHWLSFLGPETLMHSWQSFMIWIGYPLLMFGLIKKTSKLS
ncbi:MAG: hypothetical protein CL402_06290 [Acidiferrobacteraceae bacterium]|nr:hypothetical protein [Acidiferrobacteraceae bacterium]|tara:strand:+ start:1162 stop:3222 length:2061 start_codon:yes stop_codon:yes gene_type:complete